MKRNPLRMAVRILLRKWELMRRLGRGLVALALIMAAGCALAQEPEDEYVLTLEQAMRLALERNPSVAAAEWSLSASEAALDSQRARRLPVLSAGASGRRQQSLARPINIGGGVIETRSEVSDTSDVSLSLQHTFYQSGRDEAIDAARMQTAATEASLMDTRRTLLLDVASTFYVVLANQELAGIGDQLVSTAQLHLDLVNARVEAGTAAEVDRLPVQAELEAARYEAAGALNAVWQSLADLQALLALPPDELPHIRGALEEVPPAEQLTTWLETARERRPDLQAQHFRVRASELALSQARIAAGPSLSVTGSAEYGRFTDVTGETWMLAAGVSMPIFDGQSRASVDQARANLEVTQQRLADLELSITREVTQAWYALSNAEGQVTTSAAALAAAQASLEAAQARYAQEVATIVDVTDAHLAWQRAAVNHVQARYDRSVAWYRLLAAAGLLGGDESDSTQTGEAVEAGTVVQP